MMIMPILNMFKLDDITAIICNWMQTRFTIGAVRNLRKYYPTMKIIVVDDGSEQNLLGDFNTAYARDSYSKEERLDNDISLVVQADMLGFDLIRTVVHMGHGSALDYGVDKVTTPLILTMDNDIRLVKGGLVEEYLEKLNENPDNIYAVGTTYTEPDIPGNWIDPWFSLYQVKPIRELHLTFSNFIFPIPGKKSFHLGTGAFLHTMLTNETLHRPKIWKAIHYPVPESIDKLWHLKKFPDDKPSNIRYDNWQKLIDG